MGVSEYNRRVLLRYLFAVRTLAIVKLNGSTLSHNFSSSEATYGFHRSADADRPDPIIVSKNSLKCLYFVWSRERIPSLKGLSRPEAE